MPKTSLPMPSHLRKDVRPDLLRYYTSNAKTREGRSWHGQYAPRQFQALVRPRAARQSSRTPPYSTKHPQWRPHGAEGDRTGGARPAGVAPSRAEAPGRDAERPQRTWENHTDPG